MYHEVNWTDEKLKKLIKYGDLSKQDIKIMEMRINDIKQEAIAKELNISVSTVNRKIKNIKSVYDSLSLSDSVSFPPRKEKILNPDYIANVTVSSPFTIYENSFTSINKILNFVSSNIKNIYDDNYTKYSKVNIDVKITFPD